MPPRTTRAAAARRNGSGSLASSKSSKQQSAISFGQARVTKPGARQASGKKGDVSKSAAAAAAAAVERVDIPTPDDNDNTTATTTTTTKPPPASAPVDLDAGTATELAIRAQAAEESAAPLSAEEERAASVPEGQIRRYWEAKEAERLTPRVHQEDLTMHDKVLREFDMSSQFGNAIGIARTRRWKLAHELGLAPPIEVLAVLIKEGAKGRQGNKKNSGKGVGLEGEATIQRAYVDELMSSRFLVS